jgi:predicted dehydrogenase
MEAPLTTVIIGVGATVNSQGKKGGGHQIGYDHARMYGRNASTKLVAGIDINADNLRAFNETFHLTGSHADYATALRELRPDVVSICTYVGLHEPMIRACVEAGVKGIICEKPFLPSPASCVRVRELLQDSPTKLIVSHPRRYRPVIDSARELIATGRIGAVRLVSCSMGSWDLNEMGSHWFDLVRYALGEPAIDWVMGQARVRGTRGYGHAMEEAAVAYVHFANGARLVVEAGDSMPGESISIVGTEGVLRIHDEGSLTLLNADGVRRETCTAPDAIYPTEWERLWDRMLAELIAWIAGGAPSRVAFDRTIETCEAVVGAYASAHLGDRVELPFTGAAAAIDAYPLDLIAKRNTAR